MNLNSKNKYWSSKPYWCQPWSIIIFGLSALIFSWILFDKIIITSILGIFIILWWVLFLIIAPSSYELMSEKMSEKK
tara:strand:- start:1348 stop:1578 length:231 start_codon:yes stop_codon:yes gene_type:complete